MIQRLNTHGTIRRNINYWPAFVDTLMATLMIFMFQNFVQVTLNPDTLEIARIRQSQEILQKALKNKLKADPDGQKIEFIQSIDSLEIRFNDKILFDNDQATIKDTGKRIIRICSEVLYNNNHLFRLIQVEGHTNTQGGDTLEGKDHNWHLSTERALAVVKQMIASNVNEAKLTASGYGQFHPVSASIDLNRRIDLKIEFSDAQRKSDR